MAKKNYIISAGILAVVMGLVGGAILGFSSTKGEITSAEEVKADGQQTLPPLASRVMVVRHNTMSSASLQNLIDDRKSDANIQEVTLVDGAKATVIIPNSRIAETDVSSLVAEMNKNITDGEAIRQSRETQYGRSESEKQDAINSIKEIFNIDQVSYKSVLPPSAQKSNIVTEVYVDNYGYQYLVDARNNNLLKRELQPNGSFRAAHASIFNEKREYKEVSITKEQARSIAESFIAKAGIPADKVGEVVSNLQEQEGKGGAYVFLYGNDGEGIEGLKGSHPLELVIEPVTGEVIHYSSALAIQ
jgi:hypothetical protein